MCGHRICDGCHHFTQALFDLEATNADLKADLRDLYITSAKEVDVSSSRKAIIIHVRLLIDVTLVVSHKNAHHS